MLKKLTEDFLKCWIRSVLTEAREEPGTPVLPLVPVPTRCTGSAAVPAHRQLCCIARSPEQPWEKYQKECSRSWVLLKAPTLESSSTGGKNCVFRRKGKLFCFHLGWEIAAFFFYMHVSLWPPDPKKMKYSKIRQQMFLGDFETEWTDKQAWSLFSILINFLIN